MSMHTFIYYGAMIDKHDYENMTNKLDITDLYGRIFGVGLQFREIGDINKSWKYVIGKEICWDSNNMINIERKNEEFTIKDGNIKLHIDDEDEVRKKLLQIGICNVPTYKIFSCWD